MEIRKDLDGDVLILALSGDFGGSYFLQRLIGHGRALELPSLRGEVRRKRCAEGRFTCELHALKDKRRGPGWRHSEVFHGPTGLR